MWHLLTHIGCNNFDANMLAIIISLFSRNQLPDIYRPLLHVIRERLGILSSQFYIIYYKLSLIEGELIKRGLIMAGCLPCLLSSRGSDYGDG